MSTTDTTHAHTLFALGRGDNAEVLGAFAGYLAARDLVRLPIGQHLLASTTPAEVRDRFARFALAWDVAGLDTFAQTSGDPRVPSATSGRADWVPYERRRDVYAFDDGQWFLWAATDYPQWHRIMLAPDGTVVEHPVTRVYGTGYARTQGLDLAQLAAWIMGAATTRLASPEPMLSARVDTGATTG